MTTDNRTERIAQLRIELYDAKRERDELMAANVLLSQENAVLTFAHTELATESIRKDKVIGLTRSCIRDVSSLITAYVEVGDVPLAVLQRARILLENVNAQI